MSISAALVVYNEEARIEYTLRSALWCDEIVVLDKQSTDRTREIAIKYTPNVYEIPYTGFSPSENNHILERVTSEWILSLSASDLIHPFLAKQIRALTCQSESSFPYDVIHVPFRRYVLGLETSRSPWYSELNPIVFRKRVLRIRYDSVHGAKYFATDRHFKMPNSKEYCMYHLTHETMESMMDRHIRYWKAEAQTFPQEMPLRKAFNPILHSAFDVVFRRKTWLMGWDGLALIMAFMSYWMLQFVYIWERQRCHAPEVYSSIRQSIARSWDQSK
jgi:glycosyltransferase involved in cell wall biosynthesis